MKKYSERSWLVKAFIERIITGHRIWGYLRFVLILCMTAGLFYLSRVVFLAPGQEPPPVFSMQSLRYWIMPVAALIGALLVAAHYIRDIYELPTVWLGFRHLSASIFSLWLPILYIRDGKKVLKEGKINLIDVVGGPGYLSIARGSVALLERLSAASNVYGAGLHYLLQLETIREAAILDDLHGFIEVLTSTTKDGIRVKIRDVHYRFRLRAGKQLGDYTKRTPTNPYPYSIQAIRKMAYNRLVQASGLIPWTEAVQSAVSAVIVDYISRHQIDYLTAPRSSDVDSRDDMKKLFFSTVGRNRFQQLGAELLWVDIGHIEILDELVPNQRIETWQAKWAGEANVIRASGEAIRLAYQELGRAEAQAKLISTIVESLEKENLTQTTQENMRNIFLIRTAQILDALSDQTHDQEAQ